MVDTDRNNVRFVATVDSIIVRFHARYCSFHPTEKEYIEICLCLSILWHFWYGKVNYDTSSDNINCESSFFNLFKRNLPFPHHKHTMQFAKTNKPSMPDIDNAHFGLMTVVIIDNNYP